MEYTVFDSHNASKRIRFKEITMGFHALHVLCLETEQPCKKKKKKNLRQGLTYRLRIGPDFRQVIAELKHLNNSDEKSLEIKQQLELMKLVFNRLQSKNRRSSNSLPLPAGFLPAFLA